MLDHLLNDLPTGQVTLISQDLSEFALHVRAITGMHIPAIEQYGAAASAALLAEGCGNSINYIGVRDACREPRTDLRLFGKPSIDGKRRLGVGLALGRDIDNARNKARAVIEHIRFEIS